jgi:hypothetical protein
MLASKLWLPSANRPVTVCTCIWVNRRYTQIGRRQKDTAGSFPAAQSRSKSGRRRMRGREPPQTLEHVGYSTRTLWPGPRPAQVCGGNQSLHKTERTREPEYAREYDWCFFTRGEFSVPSKLYYVAHCWPHLTLKRNKKLFFCLLYAFLQCPKERLPPPSETSPVVC